MEERLPFVRGSDLVGTEAFFKRLGRGETKWGPKSFVDIANEKDGAAVAVVSFPQNNNRDRVLDALEDGDRITFKAIDVGKGNPFIAVVKL